MNETRNELQGIFREVLDDPAIKLRDEMMAADTAGGDSDTQIDLRVAIERALGFKFATAEMSRLKEPGPNIGSFVRLIDGKLRRG